VAAIVTTAGNRECHMILRGGKSGTNYGAEAVEGALKLLRDHDLTPRLMIDTSHGNSNKDHRRQPLVAAEVGAQIAAGQGGIMGVLMESFLVEGRQDCTDRERLVYGQSITDACMGWETTVEVLHGLAASDRARRQRLAAAPEALAPLAAR
jgi:3-deoxy-7-phosphoheptulonate synthase